MKNQEEINNKKTAVALVISNYLSEGSLGHTLSDIAFVANKYGLRLNRQTLHNWYYEKYLPNPNVLYLYIYKLGMLTKKHGDEAWKLLSFFMEVLDAAGYGKETK